MSESAKLELLEEQINAAMMACDLVQAGCEEKLAAALAQARVLTDDADKDVAEGASSLLGLTLFQTREFAQAWPIFEKLASGTNKFSDWFNMMTAAFSSGNEAAGMRAYAGTKAAVAKLLETETDFANIPLMPAEVELYVGKSSLEGNLPATALGACERLMSLYREIKTTDETALALRRVPFFDTALEMAAEAFAQLDESKRAAAWFAQYRGAFDDVGNEMLANAIAGDRTFKRRS